MHAIGTIIEGQGGILTATAATVPAQISDGAGAHRLDVLVPHYEDVAGLRASIASVAAQTWTGDLRVVVYDDGSSAPTQRAAETALQRSGLEGRFIAGARNRGRPFARNALLEAAQAPYIAWLDSGDIWYPRKLGAQFDALSAAMLAGRDTGSIWVTCNYDWQWIDGKPRPTCQNTGQDQTRALLVGNSLRGYLWTILGARRAFEKIGAFDPNLTRLQDLDFFLRFCSHGGRIISPADPDPLCRYVKSDIGRNAGEIGRCLDHLFRKHRPLYERHGARFVRMRRYEAALHAARFARNNGNTGLLWRLLFTAFMRHPRLAAAQYLKHGVKL
jgi:glycosyltransferase involved in cell wall biosynthesis